MNLGLGSLLRGRAITRFVYCAFAVGTACLQPVNARAYALSFVPAAQTISFGRQASVTVRVAGVRPSGLGAYDMEVMFDPTVIAFGRAVDSFNLGFAFGLGASAGVGSVTLSDFSRESTAGLLALQGDSFDLFTLVFDTVGIGKSALGMQTVSLGDAAGNPVPFSTSPGSITVAAASVAEPGTFSLVALAIFGSLGARRRIASIS